MSLLHLPLECAPTDQPAREIAKMQGLANMLDINVGAIVNDVHVTCSPGDDVNERIAFYGRQKERRHPRNFKPVSNERESA